MELCEACGTENRDKAKFCRGCARPLLPIAAGTDLNDKASNRALRCGVCQAIHSRGATTCQACGLPLDEPKNDVTPEVEPSQGKKAWRWPLLGVLALVGAVIVLWGSNQREPVEFIEGGEVVLDAQPVVALEESTQLAAPASAASAAPSMEAAMNADEKAHFEELVKRETERGEKSRKTIARLAAQEMAAKEASAAKAAAERQRVEAARQAMAQPAASAPTDSKAAVASQAPTPPPARVSVEQACAKTTNFLARDLCRVAACKDASNARDPICVWYRRLEEERARRLQGN